MNAVSEMLSVLSMLAMLCWLLQVLSMADRQRTRTIAPPHPQMAASACLWAVAVN